MKRNKQSGYTVVELMVVVAGLGTVVLVGSLFFLVCRYLYLAV
jgi:Tfp pilus assembly protein PilE